MIPRTPTPTPPEERAFATLTPEEMAKVFAKYQVLITNDERDVC